MTDNRSRSDRGAALLVVLIIMFMIMGSSASFIWFMNQQQTRAGARFRSAAALATAEAGVHQALSFLETVAPDGSSPGRFWRTVGYAGSLPLGSLEGRFTFSVSDGPGGAIIVTSAGQVGSVVRRLRARVYLTSPALLAGLYSRNFVRLDKPPGATFILPYGAGIGDREWAHIAAGRELWFATTSVSINDPSATYQTSPGPADPLEGAGGSTTPAAPGPVRLLLAPGADITLGWNRRRVDVQQLRAMDVSVEGRMLLSKTFPLPPDVDRTFYQLQAASNTSNASLNEAAGEFVGDADLARKRDSLYTSNQFERLQAYLTSGSQPALYGVVYVGGGIALTGSHRLEILGGTLVAEGSIFLGDGASLVITHTAGTRSLPGVITLNNGGLIVTQGAWLRVHGLVYSSSLISILAGAHVDVVGSVLSSDSELGFWNSGSNVVIRYDPAVLGTPGLRVPDGSQSVTWVAALEELP